MAISIDDLWFELQRRVPLYKTGTTMPDGSLLGYDGDPNAVDKDNSAGETLVYYSAQGTLYQESNGNMWRKSESPNTWLSVGGGGSGGGPIGDVPKYDSVYSTVSANSGNWYDYGNLYVTGDLDVTGTTVLSGDLTVDSDTILLGKSTSTSLIIPFGKIDGDLIPSLTNTYDIGMTDLRWQELYVEDINAVDTYSTNVSSQMICLLSQDATDPISPSGTLNPSDKECMDYVDVRHFKETYTVVKDLSAQWTFEHIHMLSRGSFTMDTPATDSGFGTEREYLCMQSNNFAGDSKYNEINHTHALVLPYDTQIKKIVIRASATAGDDVLVGVHSNRGLEPIDGYAYTYFLEQPIEEQTINFEENFQTKVVSFTPAASANEGDTIGISLSAQTAINATSITIVLLCRS